MTINTADLFSVAFFKYRVLLMQAAAEAQARLQGHEQRMTELQKEVDSAQRLMRSAQSQAREAADDKGSLLDKVCAVVCFVLLYRAVPCCAVLCCAVLKQLLCDA